MIRRKKWMKEKTIFLSVNNGKKCLKCGYLIKENYKLCPYCGVEFNKSIVCPKCSYENDYKLEFCQECGACLFKYKIYQNYKPVHSDFIIHWTGGKDIDQKFDADWFLGRNSTTHNQEVVKLYIKRLKSILKYGLWMTRVEDESEIYINHENRTRPLTARTCFTELKLSEVRNHAREYGRLGIGFKRNFLFNRMGAPMVYYIKKGKYSGPTWFSPPFLYSQENKEEKALEDFFSCFLKPMAEKFDYGKFYDECEWRIIYSDKIRQVLQRQNNDYKKIINKFKRPPEIWAKHKEFKKIYESTQEEKRPLFLIPLEFYGIDLKNYRKESNDDRLRYNQWFSMVIYPSLRVKVEAERDPEIRELLNKCKPNWKDELKHITKEDDSPAIYERYSKIIEIDLDACRNF